MERENDFHIMAEVNPYNFIIHHIELIDEDEVKVVAHHPDFPAPVGQNQDSQKQARVISFFTSLDRAKRLRLGQTVWTIAHEQPDGVRLEVLLENTTH